MKRKCVLKNGKKPSVSFSLFAVPYDKDKEELGSKETSGRLKEFYTHFTLRFCLHSFSIFAYLDHSYILTTVSKRLDVVASTVCRTTQPLDFFFASLQFGAAVFKHSTNGQKDFPIELGYPDVKSSTCSDSYSFADRLAGPQPAGRIRPSNWYSSALAYSLNNHFFLPGSPSRLGFCEVAFPLHHVVIYRKEPGSTIQPGQWPYL